MFIKDGHIQLEATLPWCPVLHTMGDFFCLEDHDHIAVVIVYQVQLAETVIEVQRPQPQSEVRGINTFYVLCSTFKKGE